MATLAARKNPPHPTAAKVALVGLQPEASLVVADVLRECALESRNAAASEVMLSDEFGGCILDLGPEAERLVRAIRHSPARSGMVLIGVCGRDADAHWYSRMGLNAVMIAPLTRAEALRAIRTTQLLLAHGMRRHVRVPIVVGVSITLDGGGQLQALTRDLSYGGMSVVTPAQVYPDRNLHADFRLPDGTAVAVEGTVIWRLTPELIGVRFSADEHPEIRRWIENYLQVP